MAEITMSLKTTFFRPKPAACSDCSMRVFGVLSSVVDDSTTKSCVHVSFIIMGSVLALFFGFFLGYLPESETALYKTVGRLSCDEKKQISKLGSGNYLWGGGLANEWVGGKGSFTPLHRGAKKRFTGSETGAKKV